MQNRGLEVESTSNVALPPPEIRATEVPADDPRAPASARAFARKGSAAGWRVKVTYARGPVPGECGRCSVCGSLVALKLDGDLKVHGPRDERCAGPERPPEPEIRIVDSILVRCQAPKRLWETGVGFASAAWIDGKADTAGIIENGKSRVVGVTEAKAAIA